MGLQALASGPPDALRLVEVVVGTAVFGRQLEVSPDGFDQALADLVPLTVARNRIALSGRRVMPPPLAPFPPVRHLDDAVLLHAPKEVAIPDSTLHACPEDAPA